MASEYEYLEHILSYRKVELGDFRIPSFKISFGLQFKNVLKELGVVLPFSEGGLTKMVDSPIWVSGIIQKSFIKVNEEGTEDAGVTVTSLEGHGCFTSFLTILSCFLL